MYDLIIVGAGPAGLTAAIYARRASKKVLVFEAKAYGGQIINTLDIENYPVEPHISGFDFATKLYNQAKDLGTEVVFEKVELYNLKEFVAMRESRIRMFISTHAPVYGKSVVFGLNVFMLNDGKISCNINSEVTNTLWCEKFNISIVDFMEKREDAKNGQA